jgi:hypothetical protein
MVNWSASPQPRSADIRCALDLRSPELRDAGLHSIAFLPDEGACAAVMVSTCRDTDAVVRLATRIQPAAMVRVESMQFDDDPGVPSWVVRESTPPPAHDVRVPRPAIVAGV